MSNHEQLGFFDGDTRTRGDEIREAAEAFHRAHPEVWDLFVKFAFEAIAAKRPHYSANAIFERIRWECDVTSGGAGEFRMNNSFRSIYARRFMRVYPEHEGFFRTRRQRSEDRAPTHRPELGPEDYLTAPDGDRRVA
jgi:hypothetical protein